MKIESLIQNMAADDRLWNTQKTVESSLRIFLKLLNECPETVSFVAALKRIARNYEDGETYSGHFCADIARQALIENGLGHIKNGRWIEKRQTSATLTPETEQN